MSALGHGIVFLERFWDDLRYGLRQLRLNRAFAAVAILSLALGIGANTALFQLLDALQNRALPVPHPEQLAEVRIRIGDRFGLSLVMARSVAARPSVRSLVCSTTSHDTPTA